MTATRHIHLILTLLWLVFLFVQTGNPYDESEHLHAAWLMEVEGLVPVEDFFQHHTPLLWEILRGHFRFGGSGPGSLLFGRWIVVLCGALTALALAYLGRSWRRPENGGYGAPLAILFLVAATVVEQRLFVLRPETLSTAAFVLALAAWLWSASRGSQGLWVGAVTAGALFAVASFSSPRFLLLAPVFPVFTRSDSVLLDLNPRRLVASSLGFLATIAVFLASSSMSVADIRFSLQFSALLQDIGRGSTVAVAGHLTVAGLWLILAALLLFLAPRPLAWRKRGLELGLLVLVVGLSAWTAGRYPYSQAFICVLILGLLLLVRWEALGGVEGRQRGPAIVTVITGVAAALLVLHLQLLFRAESTIFRVVGLKNQVEGLLGPGETILASSLYHPISAPDASYYGVPLVDSRNRLCQAVEAAKGLRDLPPCNYLEDVRKNRPRVVDQWLPFLVPEQDQEDVQNLLDTHYRSRGPVFVNVAP